jgi:hypothetical protein
MNTNENLISTGCPATAPQPVNQLVKPVKFPAQPQEWKIVSLRECPTPDTMQQCETPDQAAAYWKTCHRAEQNRPEVSDSKPATLK